MSSYITKYQHLEAWTISKTFHEQHFHMYLFNFQFCFIFDWNVFPSHNSPLVYGVFSCRTDNRPEPMMTKFVLTYMWVNVGNFQKGKQLNCQALVALSSCVTLTRCWYRLWVGSYRLQCVFHSNYQFDMLAWGSSSAKNTSKESQDCVYEKGDFRTTWQK